MNHNINSIKRTLRVLAYICRQKNGTRVTEVAKAFNMSSPAIYNYLKNMLLEGYIYKDQLTNRFRAAYKIVDLASVVMGNNEITEITYSTLFQLSEKLNTVVHLAIKEGDLAICVSKIGSSDAIPSITRVGMSFELYPTALGKAILAFLPKEDLEEYLERTELIPYTENTITSKEKLREELSITKVRRYALDMLGEHRLGLHAIGVPIFDYTNHVIGSISIPFFGNMKEAEINRLFGIVHESALEISKILGNQHLFQDNTPEQDDD